MFSSFLLVDPSFNDKPFQITMATFTHGDFTFNLGAAPAAINHGYTKAQRDALTDDTLLKVRDAAIKSGLPAKLTKGLQVSSYNPADLKDPNNFFNFVSTWQSTILLMETHMKTYYMDKVFNYFEEIVADPTSDEMAQYNAELGMFLIGNARFGGDGTTYQDNSDPTNIIDVHRPTPPTTTRNIVFDGTSILHEWHNLELQHVVHSVSLQTRFVDDPVHRQNLSWTFQYVMDCIDVDLQQHVLSKIANLHPDIGRSGPVAFQMVAERILHTTENLAQKVINGLIALRLTHFESESVVECIFTLRNVLRFLRYGEATTYAPRTTVIMLYDVFRGTSIPAFRNYIQQLQDFQLGLNIHPELLFDKVQLKYEELLLADRWVPQKKKGSVFIAGGHQTYVKDDEEKSSKSGNNGKKDDDKKGKDGKKNRPTHDKSGKKIDYTAPKSGEPHKRTTNGQEEFWCGKCARWGSHPTPDHDQWYKEFKAAMKKKNRRGNGNNGNNANNGNQNESGTTPRSSVTFLAAATSGRNPLRMDSELVDGIDF